MSNDEEEKVTELEEQSEPKEGGVKAYFNRHKTQLQVVWFLIFGLICLLAQLGSRAICDLAFQNLTTTVNIWPFSSQSLGSFLAFLISNIIAKAISFITNRKKTFKARGNVYISIVIYVVVVIALIIIETIIGTPIQNGLYTLFGGTYVGDALSTSTVNSQGLYQTCGIISQMLYGIGDAIIIFFLDKYLIMK